MKQKSVVVITGASSGIGAATARRFAREEHRVVLLARRAEKLEELKKELGAHAYPFALDVTDKRHVQEVFERIESEVGPIHLLVNNAGMAAGIEPAYQGNLDEWDRCIDTNIKGLLYCTKQVLVKMVERNEGHIVNLGSIAGTYPYPGGNVYGATKAFVHQFSLNLRADLLGKKIRVTCIEPGLTSGSEFSVVRFRGDATRAAKLYEGADPLDAKDVAESIYFCYTLPDHVNVNAIEIMPVGQASAALAVHRSSPIA